MKRTHFFGAAGLTLAVVIGLAVSPASAESGEALGHLNSTAIDQPAPAGTHIPDLSELPRGVGELELDSNLAITDIVAADDARAINTVTWNSETDVLDFYVYQADDRIQALIQTKLPNDQRWAIHPTARPVTELEHVIESLAKDPDSLPHGVQFVSGTPSADGTTITIGVTKSAMSRQQSEPLPDKLSGVPVTFVEEAPVELTTRSSNVAPVISGSYTWGGTSNGNMACTSGFPVLRSADNQYNMITADHCTDQQGVPWYFGSGTNHSIGDSTFQAPGGTDLELYTEPDSLAAWVLVGSYTDSSSALPIRGYTAPVGGNSVCYSGSRSGIVCSNVLEANDTYNCVAALQCYWTRWSTQSNGIPAAGNGDSGGPVIIPVQRTSDNTIGAYGVGVISMIANHSSSCTGEPGTTAANGRKCSANVGFASLSRWASSQSTHSLAYTTA